MALVADEPLFLLRIILILPLPVWPRQGSAYWGRMRLWGPSSWLCVETLPRGVCLDPRLLYNFTAPRFGVELINPVLCSIAIQGPHPARGTQWPRCHRGQCGVTPVGPVRGQMASFPASFAWLVGSRGKCPLPGWPFSVKGPKPGRPSGHCSRVSGGGVANQVIRAR